MKSPDLFFRHVIDAIRAGDIETVRRLFSERPDLINDQTYLGSWLYCSCRENQFAIVQALLDMGADINIGDLEFGMTNVDMAARENHVDILKLFLARGAKITDATMDENPIFIAIGNGKAEAVQVLLEAGIDPSIEYAEEEDMDAMSHAIFQGQWDIGLQLATWIAGGDRNKGKVVFHAALDKVERKADLDLSGDRKTYFDSLEE